MTWSIMKPASCSCNPDIYLTLVSTTLKKGETQLRYVLLYTQIRLLDHQLTEGEQTVRQSNHILDEGAHVIHDILH